MEPCLVCGCSRWLALPNPHERRSVLSDLRVIDVPLAKRVCSACGLVARDPLGAGVFESYELYDHAPGAPREAARLNAYADWIAAVLEVPPQSVLDVGCANGALLLGLSRHWPQARLSGIDPSAASVARARAVGVDATAGTIASVKPGRAQLVVTVNVIEHTADPRTFLRDAAAVVAPGGELMIVCPDGRDPWLELVMADHLCSFTPAHLSRLVEEAGLTLVGTISSPQHIGKFQMIRARPIPARPAAERDGSNSRLLAETKRDYLLRWAGLDVTLRDRQSSDSVVCFGIGEAAGLLRAYTPDAWSAVAVCTADAPETRLFGTLPVLDYAELPRGGVMLLGIKPQSQEAMAGRLAADGWRVVRWDDIVPA